MSHFLVANEDGSHHSVRTSRLAGWLKSSWREYLLRRRLKATVFTLHSLDDRTLHDIGLDRSEIESVVTARRDRRQQLMIGLGGVTPRG